MKLFLESKSVLEGAPLVGCPPFLPPGPCANTPPTSNFSPPSWAHGPEVIGGYEGFRRVSPSGLLFLGGSTQMGTGSPEDPPKQAHCLKLLESRVGSSERLEEPIYLLLSSQNRGHQQTVPYLFYGCLHSLFVQDIFRSKDSSRSKG